MANVGPSGGTMLLFLECIFKVLKWITEKKKSSYLITRDYKFGLDALIIK